MNKWTIAILAIIVLATILFMATRSIEVEELTPARDLSLTIPSLSPPSLDILPNDDARLSSQAWDTFQKYLKFAHEHDLIGIRSLSHQISSTCNDPLKEADCFALMDSVFALANQFTLSDFKNIKADEKQIIMYTEGPNVIILYFTRNEDGTPKVLSMKFCFEDEATKNSCAETNASTRDSDADGWWDSVESLFYSTKI